MNLHSFFVNGINENRIQFTVYFNLNPNRKNPIPLILKKIPNGGYVNGFVFRFYFVVLL
jgi:hypothetical protein